MDGHFYTSCVMLILCSKCSQIVEIKELNNHLLEECNKKKNHIRCERCDEAISVPFYEKHRARKDCLVKKSAKESNRCSLCHQGECV